jgi:5'(3')-deoxyribonucleotidase
MTKGYYFDMDGVIANFHKEPYKYVNAIDTEWIANLEPFMDNINLMLKLIARGEQVYIISKAASESAKRGKYMWLEKYLPELPKEHIFIIVGNGKKYEYIQTEQAILIDDDIKNCKQWDKASEQYTYIHLAIKGQTIKL